ncbi:MAG: ABC transporter permease subunit [Eubacteriales bacterium]|nr:ABC transporter permease subunit [Eubacteriales bacterium]
MFSKPIFKQCIRSHGKIWAIFTFVMCLILSICTWSFDAGAFGAVANAVEGTAFADAAKNFTSFLGSLESYYKMIAVLLGMVYVIITSTNLVVDEVDSGSMAYTLSTPVRRSSVVITKMIFMIGSVILMFVIQAGVGIGAAELFQHCVSDTVITDDVKDAADALNRKESYVRDHLYVIKEDENALKAGADAREMDVDSYSLYLDKAMLRKSYKAAAEELTDMREDLYEDDDDMDKDDIEITWQELEADPSLMLDCDDALKKGAAYMDMTATEYKAFIMENLDKEAEPAAQEPAGTEMEGEAVVQETEDSETQQAPGEEADMELMFKNAMEAAAKELHTDTVTLADNMLWMKDKDAMAAAVRSTGLSEETLTAMVNESMAMSALNEDYSVDFDMEVYLWLNVGCCLLILAFSAIGFFASCLFNRNKNAMTIGGGLPFAFFIISIIVEMSENLENLKYITLTTLFDTQEILALGDFGVGLGVLAGIAVVLYTAGCLIFTKKDLPL